MNSDSTRANGADAPLTEDELSIIWDTTEVISGAPDVVPEAPIVLSNTMPSTSSARAPASNGMQGAATPSEPTPSSPAVIEALTHTARMHGVLVRGSAFGVYTVGQCIGEGGMARVYQAEHEGLRRQVALKVLTNGFAKDPEGRERFVREARIAAAIKHPNVVNIFDVGVHEDVPYLVMELLEGTDLESLLQSNGSALTESLILDIMVPVVAGLIAVHDAGIVHRDLKPGNIFLAKGRYEDLEPKLLDFGVSKAAGPDQLRLTTRGLLGTPFYMSPEGLRGEEMTPLSDQYSLGVLMYECATSHAPFVAATLPELVRVISEGKYEPPQVYSPNLSKRMVRIITRAMSLDPNERFKDMRELGRELLFLAGQRTRITWGLTFGDANPPQRSAQPGSIAPLGGTVPPPAGDAPRWRKAAPWALLAAALLLLIVFGRVFGSGPDHAPPEAASASLAGERVQAPSADARVQVPSVVPGEKAPSNNPSVTAARDTTSPRGLPERPLSHNNSRRHWDAAGARARAPDPDESPEWAPPNPATVATQNKSAQASQTPNTGLASGTNGAPIFD